MSVLLKSAPLALEVSNPGILLLGAFAARLRARRAVEECGE
jgi:hypothetical protein